MESPFCVQGIPIDENNKITFDKTGNKVLNGILREDFPIAGLQCAAGRFFALRKGRPYCTLKGDQLVQGIPILGGHEVWLDDKNSPVRFHLAKDHRISGYLMKAGTEVCLNAPPESGWITVFTTAEPLKFPEIEIPAGTRIQIRPGGALPQKGDLSKSQLTLELPTPTRVSGISVVQTVYVTSGFVFDGGTLAEDWADQKGHRCSKGLFMNLPDKNNGYFLCHDLNRSRSQLAPFPLGDDPSSHILPFDEAWDSHLLENSPTLPHWPFDPGKAVHKEWL